MRSDEFIWLIDKDTEYFSDEYDRYDVLKAKALIRDTPRDVIQLPAGLFGDASDHDEEPGHCCADNPQIDLRIPIIVVVKNQNSLMAIDGWHRLCKAQALKLMTVPAVFLTPEESQNIWF